MLTEPLPKTLDVRKAAARGVSVQGALKPLELQRFLGLLSEEDGGISVMLQFARNEENHYLVNVVVEAEVFVECQRCLESMPLKLVAENSLAAVWTDEEARHLPRYVDPLITGEACDLWRLAEDELILALPAFNNHADEHCNKILAGLAQSDPSLGSEFEKPNPFDVLAQLKPGKK
jgi:uncharacterized protein